MYLTPSYWRILIVIALSFMLSACFKSAPTLPDWAKNIPNTHSSYYAVGQGVSLYDAEVNARASLAAEFSSTVSDMTRVHIVDDGDFKQQTIEQYTSVEVSKVNISNARVAKQDVSDGQYFVLLELSVADLSSQLKSELKREVREISLALKAQKTKSFEGWWRLRSVLSNAKRLARNIRLLNGLDGKPYTQEAHLLSSYFKRFDEGFEYRRLEIRNLSGLKKLTDLVSESMQKEGIVLLEHSRWRSQDKIEISIDYSTQRIGQEYHVDAELWLRLKSASGQALSQFSIKDRGVTYSGNKQSKEVASHQLYKKLKNIDIFERLLD